MKRLPFLLLVLAPVGCAMPIAGQGELEVGTGDYLFVPLAEAQEVELVFGPQGGYHVWTSLRASGLEPRRVRMELDTVPVDGGREVERSRATIDLTRNQAEGVHEFLGWPAVLANPGCDLGRLLRINVRLEDSEGVTAEGEAQVMPRATGSFPPPLCN